MLELKNSAAAADRRKTGQKIERKGRLRLK